MRTKEEILDKLYKPRMHWRLVNRHYVLQAMEEYANQFKNAPQSKIAFPTIEEILQGLLETQKAKLQSKAETMGDNFYDGAKWLKEQIQSQLKQQ